MMWRGIELERDGQGRTDQGWVAVTDYGVVLQVRPWTRSQWMARATTSRWHHVDGYGPTPEAAMAQCDERCRDVAAELLKGVP